ncbi:MAG: hypothetical protein K2H92_04515 [Bacteroidaceae bacterium]|nr:hypothetical protein [Bacteroidaceae bacterium]
MSPTPTNRSRGHRSVGVGDSDLEAVEAHCAQKRFAADVRFSCLRTKEAFLSHLPQTEAMELWSSCQPLARLNHGDIAVRNGFSPCILSIGHQKTCRSHPLYRKSQ